MQAHFRERSLDPLGVLDRLRGRQRPANALIEIENRLAGASTLRDVTVEDVETIALHYDIDVVRRFERDLADLYRTHLEHCVRDRLLSDDEVADLAHLKAILGITDAAIERLHDEVAGRIYGEAVSAAIVDRRLDPDERDFLERLQAQLRLPDEIVTRIHAHAARWHVEQLVKAADADERLSPAEEAELDLLARNLRVEIQYGARTRRRLEKFRLYWLIENGDVPEIETEIALQRGERCSFAIDADWYEPRRVTRRVQSSCRPLRIKIAKGAYWRVGDLGVQRVSEDVMRFVDSGRVFVTSKRLLFQGARGDTPISVNAIADFTAYANGVEIERHDAPNVFLRITRDVDLVAMLVGRTIRDLA